tara:strand:- start:115 stop:426 length:312 start_codon:yes stop_codon:yes gene_type:complete
MLNNRPKIPKINIMKEVFHSKKYKYRKEKIKTKPINSILIAGIKKTSESKTLLSLITPNKTKDINKTKIENSNPAILIIEILGLRKVTTTRKKISFLEKILLL